MLVEKYGQIGVCQRKGRKNLVLKYRDGERAPFEVVCKEGISGLKSWYYVKEKTIPLKTDIIWLKVIFNFGGWGMGAEIARFLYSTDGNDYHSLGDDLPLFYSLSLFVGARIGIFSYNEENAVGGNVYVRKYGKVERKYEGDI